MIAKELRIPSSVVVVAEGVLRITSVIAQRRDGGGVTGVLVRCPSSMSAQIYGLGRLRSRINQETPVCTLFLYSSVIPNILLPEILSNINYVYYIQLPRVKSKSLQVSLV
jgi:hypothetical protein